MITFAILALIAVVSAIGLVAKKNPIHGALFLVMNLGSVAALYLTLGAEFLAAAQVIVYAGAIMVLFVFAIMVLIPGKEETGPDPKWRQRAFAIPFGVLLAALLIAIPVIVGQGPAGGPVVSGTAEAIGRLLFTDYLFPFELASVLLLAAMVGVLLLARRRA